MGLTSPPPPRLPAPPRGVQVIVFPTRPVIGLDLNDPAQAHAYHVFEARRELESWYTGEAYAPIPPDRLAWADGEVLMFPDLEATLAQIRGRS